MYHQFPSENCRNFQVNSSSKSIALVGRFNIIFSASSLFQQYHGSWSLESTYYIYIYTYSFHQCSLNIWYIVTFRCNKNPTPKLHCTFCRSPDWVALYDNTTPPKSQLDMWNPTLSLKASAKSCWFCCWGEMRSVNLPNCLKQARNTPPNPGPNPPPHLKKRLWTINKTYRGNTFSPQKKKP